MQDFILHQGSPINSSVSKGAGDCASDEQIDTQQVNSFRSKLRSASKLVEVINLVDDEEMEQNENTALTNQSLARLLKSNVVIKMQNGKIRKYFF